MGEFFALGCAFTWAIAVIMFRKLGSTIHPISLNLFKNTLGFILIIPTIYFAEGQLIFATPGNEMLILVVSGILGIGVADALFLWALNSLGASRMAIVDCLYSPFIIFLAVIFIGESLNLVQLVGAGFVISAVFFISSRGEVKEDVFVASKRTILKGVIIGCVSILAMASGVLMITPLFDSLPLFWIIGVRLAAGTFGSLVIFVAYGKQRQMIDSLLKIENKTLLLTASFLATYVSMIMWVAGFKYNEASIAAVLNQTTTVFTVILAAIFLKEKLTPSKIIVTAIATTGVLMISLF